MPRLWAFLWVLIAVFTLVVMGACGAEEPGPAERDTSEPATGAPTIQAPSSQTAVSATAPALDGPLVRIGVAAFPVELAITDEERIQGLSDRDSLDAHTGMLFVLEQERRVRFWMRGMRFPLDMLWISGDCGLVGINEDVPVPPPGTFLQDLPRYGPEQDVKYVLEINAGEADALGIEVGGEVAFAGSISGEYGC